MRSSLPLSNLLPDFSKTVGEDVPLEPKAVIVICMSVPALSTSPVITVHS